MRYLTKTNGKFDDMSREALLSLPDGKYIIEKQKKKRSTEQNNALWRWDTILSKETGYTPSEIHYIMLGQIFGTKEIKVGNRVISKPIKTSSELSTIEFSQYIDIYPAMALELFNVALPDFSYEETK